jgi:hypothetical protein
MRPSRRREMTQKAVRDKRIPIRLVCTFSISRQADIPKALLSTSARYSLRLILPREPCGFSWL